MLKRMQQKLALNGEVYSQNQTNRKKTNPFLFGSYDSNEESASSHFNRLSDHDAVDGIPNDGDIEKSRFLVEDILEEVEATHSLEECQIWIPIRDKLFFESSKSHVISDKSFLSICSIESSIKSARSSDEETSTRICLLVDRFDKSLSFNLQNESSSLTLDSDSNSILNIKKEGWYKALKKQYNKEDRQLTLIIPDYATVFSGIYKS